MKVRVEEELVKARVVVVVAGDILPRPAAVVSLVKSAEGDTRVLERPEPRQVLEFREVPGAELQDLV